MNVYLRIVIIGLFYLYQFALNNILISLSPALQEAFNLSSRHLGMLGSLYFWGDILFLLPAGYLLDSYSPRKIVLITMFTSAVLVLISAIFPNIYVFGTSRFFLGMCGSFGIIGALKLSGLYVKPAQLGSVSGVITTLGMLGSFIIAMPFSIVLDHINWIPALLAMGAIGIGIFVLVYLATKTAPAAAKKPKSTISLKERWQLIYDPQILLNGLYLFLLSLPLFLLGSLWGSPMLKAIVGVSKPQATFIVSMLFVGMMIGSPLIGFLSDYFKNRKTFLYLGCLLSVVVMMFMITTHFQPIYLICLLFLILGITTSTQVLSFAIIMENYPKNLSGSLNAILAMISALAGGLGLPAVGPILSWLEKGGLSPAEAYLNLNYLFVGAFILALGITWKIKSK
jgi:MFS family permease